MRVVCVSRYVSVCVCVSRYVSVCVCVSRYVSVCACVSRYVYLDTQHTCTHLPRHTTHTHAHVLGQPSRTGFLQQHAALVRHRALQVFVQAHMATHLC